MNKEKLEQLAIDFQYKSRSDSSDPTSSLEKEIYYNLYKLLEALLED